MISVTEDAKKELIEIKDKNNNCFVRIYIDGIG